MNSPVDVLKMKFDYVPERFYKPDESYKVYDDKLQYVGVF